MKVLLTGHGGIVGSAVNDGLVGDGHVVVGCERGVRGGVLNLKSLKKRAAGCDVIVHAAAVPGDPNGTPDEIMKLNTMGTWNVLRAAAAVDARVVFFSTPQVTGAFMGEGRPDYLPVDDDHPRRGSRPYGLSKRIGEDMCEAFTARTGLTTVCLRPVHVWEPHNYEQIWRARREQPESELAPFWEYGAFVDIRDVVTATSRALDAPLPVHSRMLLASDDIAASRPTREMVALCAGDVEWRGGDEYERDPWRGLVDCSRAKDLLGWQPQHRWADWIAARERAHDRDTARA